MCTVLCRAASIFCAQIGITDPGPKTSVTPALNSASYACGGITPPTNTRMSSRPSFFNSAMTSGTSVECPPCQARYAEHVDVILHGHAGRLARCLKQRTDVDIEADIRKCGRDHFRAAIVAVLTHLRNQDAGTPAFCLANSSAKASAF